jgi:hypothetical protein
MNTLINTLKTILGKCLPIWNYTLLENDIIALHLSNIVLAVIIYFTGRKLSHVIITMLDKYVLKSISATPRPRPISSPSPATF